MPLLKGQPYLPSDSPPAGLKRAQEVWLVRITGELFTDYETYVDKIRLYNEPIWTCSVTQRTGLSFLQAATSEARHKQLQNEEVVRKPIEKPTGLQLSLTSVFRPEMIDPEIQLLRRFLRTEARRCLLAAAVIPEPTEASSAADSNNKSADSSKKKTSGQSKRDSEQAKSDAKKIPGTVKHTIYETLKWVGEHGASIVYLQQRLKDCNIKTTWAESSARNCIASMLNHDKAFVKLPKHGHYALALYFKSQQDSKQTQDQNEKRDLASSSNEGEISSYPRNNQKCMVCSKSKHGENSPLILCDQCPSAVHLACIVEQEFGQVDENGPVSVEEKEKSISFPFLCYKCIEKKKLAEKQKVIRQKREEEKQKRREEKTNRQQSAHEKKKENEKAQSEKHKGHPAAKKNGKFPIEDLHLTEEDHCNREELIQGPVLPAPHSDSEMLLDVICISEFLTTFGADLDEKSTSVLDVTVAELMYSLNWPFDSSLLRNVYLPLVKMLIKIKLAGSEGFGEARRWNTVVDGWTWPELVKIILRSHGETQLTSLISQELDAEQKLFLELTPRTHLNILLSLVNIVSGSSLIRQVTDYRLSEAKKLESEIFKMKKEINKAIALNKAENGVHAEDPGALPELVEAEISGKRKLRRRGEKEESPEMTVRNKVSELEEQLERCKVRCEPFGYDRFHNGYYWFASLSESLCVINATKNQITCLRSKEELDSVMAGLDIKGIREKQLLQALKEDYENLVACLSEKEFSFDLDQVPRGLQCTELELLFKANKKHLKLTTEKLKEEYEALAAKTMISRLQKLMVSLAAVDSDTMENLQILSFEISALVDFKSIYDFLVELSKRLRRIFEDGNEKQNGKKQNRLMTYLDILDGTTSCSSVSQIALFINNLKESMEPLIRSKTIKLHISLTEAKRKRSEREQEEKSTNSSADAEVSPSRDHKKIKQKQTPDSTVDVLAFVEMPGRITRSRARTYFQGEEEEEERSLENEEHESREQQQQEEEEEEESSKASDEDYEVEGNGSSEVSGQNPNSVIDEDALCKVCNFGGRLIHCQGKDCEMSVHHGCMFGGGHTRPVEYPWYCSKCSRVNRALQRKINKGSIY